MSTITQTKAMINQKRETALFMARQGFALVPLRPASKIPYTELLPTNAFGQASWSLLALRHASEMEIKFWFEHDPLCNYGIITGMGCVGARCLCVVDVDRPQNIPPGLNIPPTVAVKTAKGSHFYYYSDNEVRSRKLPFGDLKASSGIAVAPGSVHETGVVYEFYDTMSPAEMAIAELPTWASDTDAGRVWGPDPIKPLETQNLETGKRHRNNSVTMPDSFEGAEKLNQRPEVAFKIMGLCGRDVVQMKKAFCCPLPGHGERKPSAALYQEPGRPIVMNDFHEREPDRRMWPLVDVYASCMIGQAVTLKKGERALWWLRALDHAGYLTRPTVLKQELPCDAKKEAITVYNGFCYLLELRQCYEPSNAAPFNRHFAARWCGVDKDFIRRGMTWLLRQGYLTIAERGRPNSAEGGPALTMFKLKLTQF